MCHTDAVEDCPSSEHSPEVGLAAAACPNPDASRLHGGLLSPHPCVPALPAWNAPVSQSPGSHKAFTVLEDPFHVEPIGGARLVVCAPLQVVGELPCPGIIDDPGVGGTYGICNRQ